MNLSIKNNRTIQLLIAAACCWITGMTTLQSQQWQYVYGGDNTSEDGFRRVTPVTGNCSSRPGCLSCSPQTDGYIAVGTTYDPMNDDDVYVIRTDNNGAAIWETTYDISGNGSNDEGRSIIELSDGSGFVVVGNTNTYPNFEAFLMKIDCDGNVLWTQTYRGPLITGPNTTGATGMDVIETTTGDATWGTSTGDLVVTGSVATGTNGFEDGLIFRTTSTGTLIWNSRYITGSQTSDRLNALIEATPLPGIATGDIIATGNIIQGGSYQAYVLRVDGNFGTINLVPGLIQGGALYGAAALSASRFFSLVELQNPAEIGSAGQPNVVLVGHSDALSGFGGTEMYFVKLDNGDPCTPLVQRLNGDSDPITPEVDMAYDVKEVTIPFGQGRINQWDLIVTGLTTMVTGGGNNDAMLVGINPGNLTPIAGSGRAYPPSTATNNSDQGWSLAIVDAVGGRTQGVVMCGTTRSDWMSVGDQQDVLLLKTDQSLSTGLACESPYYPQSLTTHGVECIDPDWGPVLTQSAVVPDDISRDWGDPACSGSPIKGTPDITTTPSNDAVLSTPYDISLTSNSIHTGDEITLLFDGEELPAIVQIDVVNALGKSLQGASLMQLQTGEISINTSQWPAGIYFITIDDRSYRNVVRVALTE